MSPGWDNGSESSAQVGHGRKKVSAKARGNSGCDLSAQKINSPINIHAFQPSPANFATLAASSSAEL